MSGPEDTLQPTMRLRFVRREILGDENSESVTRMILQQYFEDGWHHNGVWRDVQVTDE